MSHRKHREINVAVNRGFQHPTMVGLRGKRAAINSKIKLTRKLATENLKSPGPGSSALSSHDSFHAAIFITIIARLRPTSFSRFHTAFAERMDRVLFPEHRIIPQPRRPRHCKPTTMISGVCCLVVTTTCTVIGR